MRFSGAYGTNLGADKGTVQADVAHGVPYGPMRAAFTLV